MSFCSQASIPSPYSIANSPGSRTTAHHDKDPGLGDPLIQLWTYTEIFGFNVLRLPMSLASLSCLQERMDRSAIDFQHLPAPQGTPCRRKLVCPSHSLSPWRLCILRLGENQFGGKEIGDRGHEVEDPGWLFLVVLDLWSDGVSLHPLPGNLPLPNSKVRFSNLARGNPKKVNLFGLPHLRI